MSDLEILPDWAGKWTADRPGAADDRPRPLRSDADLPDPLNGSSSNGVPTPTGPSGPRPPATRTGVPGGPEVDPSLPAPLTHRSSGPKPGLIPPAPGPAPTVGLSQVIRGDAPTGGAPSLPATTPTPADPVVPSLPAGRDGPTGRGRPAAMPIGQPPIAPPQERRPGRGRRSDRPARRSNRRLVLTTVAIFLVVGPVAAGLGYAAALTLNLVTGSDESGEEAAGKATTTTVAPSTSVAAPVTGSLTISFEDHELVVSGVVPDRSDLDAISDAVEATYGEFGSTDLSVDATAPAPEWIDAVPDLVHAFVSASDADLTIGDDGSELSGRFPDRAALDRLTAALDPAFGFPPVDITETEIVTRPSPELIASAADGVLRLSGTVPDAETRDRIVEAGAELFGEIDVADEIEVDPGVAAPFELRRFPDDLTLFAGLGDFEITVDGDGFHAVTLDGVGFERNRSVLDDETRRSLDGLPELLVRSGQPVELLGHAGEGGDEATQLARARAEAVARVLIAAGVDDGSVTAEADPDGVADGRAVLIVVGSPDR